MFNEGIDAMRKTLMACAIGVAIAQSGVVQAEDILFQITFEQ